MKICIEIHCNPILQDLTMNPGIRDRAEANIEKLRRNLLVLDVLSLPFYILYTSNIYQ
jgi:hypothetical protein